MCNRFSGKEVQGIPRKSEFGPQTLLPNHTRVIQAPALQTSWLSSWHLQQRAEIGPCFSSPRFVHPILDYPSDQGASSNNYLCTTSELCLSPPNLWLRLGFLRLPTHSMAYCTAVPVLLSFQRSKCNLHRHFTHTAHRGIHIHSSSLLQHQFSQASFARMRVHTHTCTEAHTLLLSPLLHQLQFSLSLYYTNTHTHAHT